MFKKYCQYIFSVFVVLLTTSSYAAQYIEKDEGKNDSQETAIIPQSIIDYYNYTIKYSKKKIDNSVDPDDLEEEQQDLKDSHIAEKFKNKQGAIFFMVITSNNKTKELNKFFFFNRDPNIEKDAVRKAQKSCDCHVISHTKLRLSPHIIFQVLGWLEQEQNKYLPIFIHSNSPICVTCNAIVSSFFNLHMLSNAKGCNGSNSLNLENTCPLAQQYIKREFTLPLAKKILLPALRLQYKNKLKLLENVKEKNENLQNSYNSLKVEKDNFQNKHNKLKKKYKYLKDSTKKQLFDNLLIGHTSHVYSVAVTNNNQFIVSGSYDKTIRIWDLKTGKELPYSPLRGHAETLESVAVTKDSKYIVSASCDKTIRIWDLKAGKELPYSPLKGHTGTVCDVAVTTNNQYIVSGSCDNTIRIWDFNTGKELPYSPLKGHTYWVYSVTVTKDSKYIVSCSGSCDHTIHIWDFKTGKEVSYSPLKGHTDIIRSMVVTADNQYIVSGSMDNTLCIWELATGKELSYSPLLGHTDSVISVMVTTDNRYIISGSEDKTIRIWHFKTGKELHYSPLKGHTAGVMSVAVTNDNKYVISASCDKTIRIWDLKLLAYLAEDEDEHKNDNEIDNNEVFDID